MVSISALLVIRPASLLLRTVYSPNKGSAGLVHSRFHVVCLLGVPVGNRRVKVFQASVSLGQMAHVVCTTSVERHDLWGAWIWYHADMVRSVLQLLPLPAISYE